MKTFFSSCRRLSSRAFSLVEILVAMALLSFIVLGLLTMFNQTQRAFRRSLAETDILEGSRGIIDMVVRDLQEVAPANRPAVANNRESYNFFTEISTNGVVQDLPGTIATRVNVLQRFFFLTRNNQDFVGIGYKVQPDAANSGVGTLYRWSAYHAPRLGPLTLSQAFTAAPIQSFNRIADGVVHLRLTTYATNGCILSSTPMAPACFAVDNVGTNAPYARARNTAINDGPLGQEGSYFVSNAVPAFVELEIGVLESDVLKRWRGMSPVAGANYLSNHVAQVHIFRQRIPIRNADYSAYQ